MCNTLPCPADSNKFVIVKHKRKLQYRGHVYFEYARLNFILRLLQCLKLNNLLYHDIKLNFSNTQNFLINEKTQESLLINVLNNIDINEEIPMMIEKNNLSFEEVLFHIIQEKSVAITVQIF